MRMILLAGAAGSGKDTVAKMLVPRHPVLINNEWVDAREWDAPISPEFIPLDTSGAQIAFADRIKELCLDVYGFHPRLLWGPSDLRNELQEDWPFLDTISPKVGNGNGHDSNGGNGGGLIWVPLDRNPSEKYLTPRRALQLIGTEGGRAAHPDTWTRYGYRRAKQLSHEKVIVAVNRGSHRVVPPADTVVISDLRFPNEAEEALKDNNELWFIDRPRRHSEGSAWQGHASESHLEALKEMATHQINNNGSLWDLYNTVKNAYRDMV